MELLDYSCSKSRFGSSIGGQLLARVLASSAVFWVGVAAILKKRSVLRTNRMSIHFYSQSKWQTLIFHWLPIFGSPSHCMFFWVLLRHLKVHLLYATLPKYTVSNNKIIIFLSLKSSGFWATFSLPPKYSTTIFITIIFLYSFSLALPKGTDRTEPIYAFIFEYCQTNVIWE